MNDERPIEKLLRRHANQRRGDAGPPVELHPATRRLLQGEVANQSRIKNAKVKRPGLRGEGRHFFSFAFLTHHVPRLAWAVPLFALVALGLWSLLDRPATQQLALGPRPSQMATAAAESQGSNPKPETAGASGADARIQTADAGRPPAAVPVRSLNVPAPGLADHDRTGKNRRAEQFVANGGAPDPPVNSLADAAEPKRDSTRPGFEELSWVAKDKSGIGSAAAAAPARLGPSSETASTRQLPLDASNARSFAALRADPRPTDPTAGSDAPRQLNGTVTGVYAAKVAAPVAAALATTTPSTTRARPDGLERDRAQTYSQSFANLAPEALKQKAAQAIATPPISPVLANFRVEQTGRQLRVVDGDGSTYLGETDALPEVWAGRAGAGTEGGRSSGVFAAKSDGGKQEQVEQLFQSDGKLNLLPAEAKSIAGQPMQNNFYRVTGTNRTLNQAVVFTWSFVELTNAPVLAQSGSIGGELNKEAKKLPAQFPAPLQNSYINGRAQFGPGKEIEINAVPVPP